MHLRNPNQSSQEVKRSEAMHFTGPGATKGYRRWRSCPLFESSLKKYPSLLYMVPYIHPTSFLAFDFLTDPSPDPLLWRCLFSHVSNRSDLSLTFLALPRLYTMSLFKFIGFVMRTFCPV